MTVARFIGLWAPVVAFMVAVFTLSGKFNGPLAVEAWDKLVHFVSYCLFGFLCLRATHGGIRPLRAWPTLLGLLLTLSFGAMDEWNQASVPGRVPSVLDWFADALGGAVSVVLLAVANGRMGDRKR